MKTPLNKRYLCRGKRVDNGEWIEGNILMTENWASILTCTDFCGSSDEPPSCDVREYEVVYETVGQYTGLTDKNGKRIFEGDIVKFVHKGKPEFNDDYPFSVGVGKPYSRNYKIEYINTFSSYGLRFINGSIHFPCKQGTLLMYDCEVVGNIHDNPELIKEGAK